MPCLANALRILACRCQRRDARQVATLGHAKHSCGRHFVPEPLNRPSSAVPSYTAQGRRPSQNRHRAGVLGCTKTSSPVRKGGSFPAKTTLANNAAGCNRRPQHGPPCAVATWDYKTSSGNSHSVCALGLLGLGKRRL